MKKFTILVSLLFSCAIVFAQNSSPIKAQNPAYFLERNLSSGFTNTWKNPIQIKKHLSGTRGVMAYDTLGTAGNAYTTLEPESNDVAADNNLRTVIFIHRNDNTKFENVISHYRYDVSFDGGLNWTKNIGPLNPKCSDVVGQYNSRFPQITIYNPAGGDVIDSSYLAYLGAWHDNTSAASNSIWNGIITGVEKLTADTSTRTEHDMTVDNGNTLIASSLVHGLPGQFWAVDNEQSGGTNDSMIILYQGIWDTLAKDINWIVYKKLNPHYANYSGTTNKLTPVIGFDPTGMMGWVGSLADFGGNSSGSFTPYFFNTTDGGITWNGPYVLDMTTIHCIMDRVDPFQQGNIPLAGFDLDMSVDKNGAPHLATVVGLSDLNYAITPPYDLYDFSYSASSNSWNVNRLDTILTFRGQIGNGSEGAYDQDNRPQVSTTPDGSKVLFIWSDSPSNSGGDNSVPDLMGIGYDANTNQWTVPTDFTLTDPIWNGNSTFPSVSPNALKSGSTATVPVVITKLDASLDPTLPATFFYFENVNFDDDSYTIPSVNCTTEGIFDIKRSDANIRLFPNPANDVLFINGSTEIHNSTLNVYNVMGQLVFTGKINNSSSYTLNTHLFAEGIYTLSVVNGNSISTNQFIVSH